MKNIFKILISVSVLLNVILFVFLFPENKVRAKFFVMNLLGFQAPESRIKFSDILLIQDYDPVSTLQSPDTRTVKMPSLPIIETHGHLGKFFNTTPDEVTKQMNEFNMKGFINLSFTTGKDFVEMKKKYSDPRIIHFSTFNWKRMEESEDFVPLMLKDLQEDISNGTRGIKLWKNFGLNLKKKNGERLKMDDPVLDPLFQLCSDSKLLVSIHTADPVAFFSPIDSKNERFEELLRHPEWSFSSKEFPAFETVMQERENLFKRHPNLIFVSLHFGEYASDLQKIDKLLSENSNVYIDLAARIDELGRQPLKSGEFIARYSDRILFGTDGPPDKGKLEIYSRFLETKDEYFDYYPSHKPRKGFWKIYGLGLDKKILEKIYFKNAEKLYKF